VTTFKGTFNCSAAWAASLVPSFLGMPKGVFMLKVITSMPCRRINSVASMLSNPPESKLMALTRVITLIYSVVANNNLPIINPKRQL
jgi:hypothetical protein